MRPIKILHVIGIMNRGGAEAMIMNLYRNIDRNLVQFDFVENTHEKGSYEQEIQSLGGSIFHCPKFNGNMVAYTKWWNDFFAAHNNEYEFVHGHIGSTAAMYLSAAKKHGIKTIAHSHNTFSKNFSLKLFRYQLFSYPTRFIADYFFACSEEAGISRYGKRTSFQIIRNAIDTSAYIFDGFVRERMRQELDISDHAFVLGNVGRFYEQKNHKFLLKVFKSVLQAEPDSILLLVGDGPLKNEIEELAKELDIFSHIKFLGVREDVPELLSCMDIMVFPSLYEGFGIAALEAQTNGLRVLCSEGVSKECCITDYFYSKDLSSSATEWAAEILKLRNYQRISPISQIKNAGYDIKDTAGWLQSFYLSGGNVDE